MRITRQLPPPVVAAPAADPAKKGDAPAAKDAAVAGVPYLEFSVSTIALPESSTLAAKAEALPAPLLGTVNAAPVLNAAKALAAGAQK